jgi:hypothetical protein
MTGFRRASIERVRHELPQVVVREFPNTSHMSILVLAQDTVTAAIREFLGVQDSSNVVVLRHNTALQTGGSNARNEGSTHEI